MGLPSKKRTNTSKRQRASHFALKGTNVSTCSACGAEKLSHRACPACGTYRGKKAAQPEKRTVRREKRLKKVS